MTGRAADDKRSSSVAEEIQQESAADEELGGSYPSRQATWHTLLGCHARKVGTS